MPKPSLVVAVPNSRRVFMEWAMSMCMMDTPINTSVTRMWTQPSMEEVNGPCTCGTILNVHAGGCESKNKRLVRKIMPVDEARNFLVEQSLAIADPNGFIFFLDDDVLPPRDTLPKLLYALNQRPDYSAIAGIYCSKTNPPAPTIAMHGGQGPYWNWKLNDIFECPLLPTGLLLIRLSVFKSLPKPWFKTITTWGDAIATGYAEPSLDPLNTPTSAFYVTDDFFWCERMRRAGFKMLAHGGVLALHVDDEGRAYGLPSDCYPLQPVIQSAKGGK